MQNERPIDPTRGTDDARPSTPAGHDEKLFDRRNGVYAAALAGGVVLHAVNMFMTATVMPSVVADIGGLDAYAWATTLFVVASILAAALTARLIKELGPRGAYLVAALLFGGGTLIASLAPSMTVLLVGRTVQGFGGGFFYALAYAVTRLVLPPSLWGRAVGLISGTFGVATLIGPALGGVFAEHNAWRAAFWSLLPFIALFALLAAVRLPAKVAGHREEAPIAWPQLILLAGAVLAISAGSLADARLLNLAGFALALAMTALIGRFERSAAARLMPRGSFSLKAPLGVVYLAIALLMLTIQPEIFIPYLLQTLHGQTPLFAGYLAALIAVGWTAGTAASVRWRQGDGTGPILAGLITVLAGLALFGLFGPMKSDGDLMILTPICVGLFLLGFGIGMAWPCLVTRVYHYAPAGEQDISSGGMTTVQLFASAFGTAMAGMVANLAGFADPGGTIGAGQAALWLAIAAAAPAALAVPLALRIARLARSER